MKKEKLDKLYGVLGRLMLDIAKLCFGGIVISTIVKGYFIKSSLFWLGIIVTFVLMILGIVFIVFFEE